MRLNSSIAWIEGGSTYNLVSLIISVAGFVFSLLGIWYAILQTKRTRQAAEAAKIAADDVSKKVNAFTSAIDLARMLAYIGER